MWMILSLGLDNVSVAICQLPIRQFSAFGKKANEYQKLHSEESKLTDKMFSVIVRKKDIYLTADLKYRNCIILVMIILQYIEGEKQLGETENQTGLLRSKWQMSCPLPDTPVSLNASFSEPGASMYGFMVK